MTSISLSAYLGLFETCRAICFNLQPIVYAPASRPSPQSLFFYT